MGTKPSLAEQWQERAAALAASQNIVTGQTKQSDVSITISGSLASPDAPEEAHDATSSSPSSNLLHMLSDLSDKKTLTQVWYVNP